MEKMKYCFINNEKYEIEQIEYFTKGGNQEVYNATLKLPFRSNNKEYHKVIF